mmetsp:Transcript_84847/g.245315  ORF Transcript_84847/g.245315 Transcript_84847/m.245315 type:complete len:190 (-) Transcript_84847:211-780(-)
MTPQPCERKRGSVNVVALICVMSIISCAAVRRAAKGVEEKAKAQNTHVVPQTKAPKPPTMKDDGMVQLPDGSTFHPFNGMEPESTLKSDAFVCHAGALFAVKLPVDGKEDSFIYLRHDPKPAFDPVQCFVNLVQPTHRILLFPPMGKAFPDWRVVHRIESLRPDIMSKVRLFATGISEHPCRPVEGQEG